MISQEDINRRLKEIELRDLHIAISNISYMRVSCLVLKIINISPFSSDDMCKQCKTYFVDDKNMCCKDGLTSRYMGLK